MFTGNVYGIRDMAKWTRFETMWFFLIIVIWVCIYHFFETSWLRIPWTPIALIGTAVAFVIGFQNNSVYDRIWESRKIWGGIVNTSRTFGVFVQDMVNNDKAEAPLSPDELEKEIKILTYRHIAWMTALRHAMRAERSWEVATEAKTNQEWGFRTPESKSSLSDELKEYLSDEDIAYVLSKGNHQTAILYLQSHHLNNLKKKGLIWEFSFLKLEGVIEELFTLQGKSERIKNFPYPRQYASLNRYFMWLLLLLLPMGVVPQFLEIAKTIAPSFPVLGNYFIWFAIPIYVAVAWVFHTMERIGRTGENPFEGTANDVPISTIARGIEIDLRQNLNEPKEQLPIQFPIQSGVQF